MQMSVIGCGYLGAVHAACMAWLGHDVVGVDLDADKVAALNAGRPSFHEPGLADVLAPALESGRLRFSTDLGAAAGARVHFVCVGTPQRGAGGPPTWHRWTRSCRRCSRTSTSVTSWSGSPRCRSVPRPVCQR